MEPKNTLQRLSRSNIITSASLHPAVIFTNTPHYEATTQPLLSLLDIGRGVDGVLPPEPVGDAHNCQWCTNNEDDAITHR
jgi:hypothetical protein